MIAVIVELRHASSPHVLIDTVEKRSSYSCTVPPSS